MNSHIERCSLDAQHNKWKKIPKLYLNKKFFLKRKKKKTHTPNQSIPSGNFETWMLIESTLKLTERAREKKENLTIKGSGMKIIKNNFRRCKATE